MALVNKPDTWGSSPSTTDIGRDGSRPDRVIDPEAPPLEWVVEKQLAHLRRVGRAQGEDLVRRAQARSAQMQSPLASRALPSAFDAIRWRAGVERSAGDEPATLPGPSGQSTEMVVWRSPPPRVPASPAPKGTVKGRFRAVSSAPVGNRRARSRQSQSP